MQPDTASSTPQAPRIAFSRLGGADVQELANLLADPEVTRSIMAKATTPEQCLKCARQRIDWHNSFWDTLGYGVWALRRKTEGGDADGPIIGWCGLTATSHGPTPEILYGFARDHWGGGFATEAAKANIDWAFANDICDGIDAVIFGSLNPGSAAVARKLGMDLTHQMTFSEFLPEAQLGQDVLDYEIWRLREGACIDLQSLLFQAPFKSGLIVSTGIADATETLAELLLAALHRADTSKPEANEITARVKDAFEQGLKNCDVDVYHLSRSDWFC